MPICVESRASERRVPRGLTTALGAIVRATLTLERRTAGEITIVLARDPELRELNRRWRGIDRATDVLSFPYGDRGRRVDGDLVISLDRLAAQAKRYRVSPGKELARLIVHGTLHLAGHDHHRASERTLMRRQERGAMKACSRRVAALERALARVAPAAR